MGRNFQINAGVRQGCVLRPKIFSAVHHWAMVWCRTMATDSSHRASVPDNRCWESYGDEEYVNENASEIPEFV